MDDNDNANLMAMHEIIRDYVSSGIIQKLDAIHPKHVRKRQAVYKAYNIGDKGCFITNYFEESYRDNLVRTGKDFYYLPIH